MNWYFDTSVLVTAAVSHHPHNAAALSVLEELLRRRHQGFTGAHSLAEFYSVLTRTPFKPPIYPSESWMLIAQMILPHLELVTLSPEEYVDVVGRCAAEGWTGGRVHDSIQLRCSKKVKPDRVYTLNAKDFRALASQALEAKITAP